MKAKVTGIGGVFFKCEDVAATKAWYQEHLGLPVDDYGCTFWTGPTEEKASQQWSPFKKDSTYFNPGNQEFMINYRVDDLVKLIEQLKDAGVEIAGEIEEFDYGKFGWIIDIDGRKVELWEPANEELFEK
ncbi:VOC family protein [Nonlabens ulvanivorans]|uniref:Enzyme related to lactoylglutathione lyase n=1 Tax=Nonlabens ulvanivorans TaxID=906888 RepID=A0A081D8A8_NONUL|nr:VOC family protein [Nonlabens ulvanivorans]KEZ92157.1 glyoxalase [Nonlabens ulvanivorans]PRX14985.1 putative enzyme related to lactoylglutathione lyase [Nonlabens ulvanivorans]GAK75154.1 glyoxalase/bleomycin resistanceprotein/dioxygenase family protein [Nonlabens ulvanivorans]GAK99031.1 glyoxalase/Bleomycin resistance protein/dioxygenase family protein [Nonlabens ulvanivorans]